jgi:hypothetical protein
MAEPEAFYEIELKALMSEEKYKQLLEELPTKFKLINEDTIHTQKYIPGDIKLRHSDKIIEFVSKEADPTKSSRKEVTIPLASKEELNRFSKALEALNFKQDPPWITHKKEFEIEFQDRKYMMCLQHIENFAYILEVEFLSRENEKDIHEPNIKQIIQQLGLEPINRDEFSARVQKYIEDNKGKIS